MGHFIPAGMSFSIPARMKWTISFRPEWSVHSVAQIRNMPWGGKIFYCRPVQLGSWETFHNKGCSWNDIPKRLVVTLSVRTLDYSHKICGDTYHNKLSELWPKTALWENTSCICVCGMHSCRWLKHNMNEIEMINNAWIYDDDIVITPTQPQLNSKVGCDMKMTLVHPPPHHHHHKLNVSNISAVTDSISTKL